MFFQLEENRYCYRVVPIEHLKDLEAEIEERRREGILPEALDRNYIGRFVFEPPSDFQGARSLIVMAAPRPPYQAVFHWKGREHRLLVPVTYSFCGETLEQMEGQINVLLSRFGHRAVLARLPCKLLAVRSGLAFYGRNNITYIPGMGSYFQLAAFYSDLPAETDPFKDHQIAPDCQECSACLNSCPTGAISLERFRVRTELCMAYYSENAGEFPSWLRYSPLECLIGCARCQEVCPMNIHLLGWVGGMQEFSEEETRVLMVGDLELSPSGGAIKEKLALLGVQDAIEVFPRNIKAALE